MARTIRGSGLLLGAGAIPLLLWAAGISIPYGEIRVDNLIGGHVYTGSRDILKGPYIVRNNTDMPLDFTVEISSPSASRRLVDGYEPIPDPTWVTFAKDYFSAGPGQAAENDFYVAVPADPRYRGKKYQVQITARTVGAGFMEMGLGGRALLSVHNDAPPLEQEKSPAVRLRVEPKALFAKDLPLGRRISLEEAAGGVFVIHNDSDSPAVCKIKPALIREAYVQPPFGYGPAPQVKFLKLATRQVEIPAHGTAKINGSILIPSKDEYRGLKCYVVVQVESLDRRAPVEKFGRLFMETVR